MFGVKKDVQKYGVDSLPDVWPLGSRWPASSQQVKMFIKMYRAISTQLTTIARVVLRQAWSLQLNWTEHNSDPPGSYI